MHGNRFIDRSGQRYGSMVVVKYAGVGSKGDILWECLCDCGKTVVKRGHNLPKVKSCGNTCTATWNTELPLIREEGEPFGIIYKLTNKKDGKVYIGQTVFSLDHRWKRHVEYANRGGEGYLQKAIRMYGPESFTREQIAVAYDKHQLDELEKHYIRQFDSLNSEVGYNQTWRPSQDDDARQTMSEKNSGDKNPAYRDEIVDDDIATLYAEGKTLSQIEKLLGFPRSTLAFRLKKLGIEVKLQPNQKDLPLEEICNKYLTGSSFAILAKEYGVNNWTIRDRIIKAGITPRPAQPPKNANGYKREDVTTEALAAQFKAGLTLSDLSRVHKMDRKTIRYRLQQAGIETRKNVQQFRKGWSTATEAN